MVQISDFIEVGKAGELENGAMKGVLAQGREILLARVGGSYYAADNRCPHMGGKLSQGKLEGFVVTCPMHGSQFDLRDGRVVRWLKEAGVISRVAKVLKSPKPLAKYKVKVENDRVVIEI